MPHSRPGSGTISSSKDSDFKQRQQLICSKNNFPGVGIPGNKFPIRDGDFWISPPSQDIPTCPGGGGGGVERIERQPLKPKILTSTGRAHKEYTYITDHRQTVCLDFHTKIIFANIVVIFLASNCSVVCHYFRIELVNMQINFAYLNNKIKLVTMIPSKQYT